MYIHTSYENIIHMKIYILEKKFVEQNEIEDMNTSLITAFVTAPTFYDTIDERHAYLVSVHASQYHNSFSIVRDQYICARFFINSFFSFQSVFAWPINNTMFRPDDQTISMRMVLYWTNFAKTG